MSNVSEQISEIEVGGRNYFSSKTKRAFDENNEYTLADYQNTGSFAQFYNLTKPMSYFVGKKCILSFDCISLNGSTQISVYNNNNSPRYLMHASGIISPISNEWTHQVLTVTVTDRGESEEYSEEYSNKIEFYCSDQIGCKIRNVKFEIGTKGTDWTPAPEDIDSDITGLADRVTTAETSILENSNEIALRAKKTEVKQQISEIEVGGRNLLLKSKEGISKNTSEYFCAAFDLSEELVVGEEYTIRCNVTVSAEKKSIAAYVGGGSYACANFSDWPVVEGENTCVHTFTATEAMVSANNYIRIYASNNAGTQGATEVTGTCVVNWIKLEKGNKATDWSPAPEDMATSEDAENAQTAANNAQATADSNSERITVSESEIRQLAEMISTLVTDGNGASLMTQTAEGGWTFSMGSIVDALAKAQTDVNTLSGDMSGANSEISALKSALDDLGVLSDYVIITTYNDQPCIELGETENGFKLRITNTEIHFADGTTIPAYITNKKLMINQAEVKEELQFGGFVWKLRSNENLGLIWKGVES